MTAPVWLLYSAALLLTTSFIVWLAVDYYREPNPVALIFISLMTVVWLNIAATPFKFSRRKSK